MCARAARLVLLALCAQGVGALDCKQGEFNTIKAGEKLISAGKMAVYTPSKKKCSKCPAGQTSSGGTTTTCFDCVQGCYESNNICYSQCAAVWNPVIGSIFTPSSVRAGKPIFAGTVCMKPAFINSVNELACSENRLQEFLEWPAQLLTDMSTCDSSGNPSKTFNIHDATVPPQAWYIQSLLDTDTGSLPACDVKCEYALQPHMQACESDFAGNVVVQPSMTLQNSMTLCASCSNIEDSNCLGARYQTWSTTFPEYPGAKSINSLSNAICKGRTMPCLQNLHAISAPVCYWVENAMCYSTTDITLMAGNNAGKKIEHVAGHKADKITVRIAHLNQVEQIVTINFFIDSQCSGPVTRTSQGNFIPPFVDIGFWTRLGSFKIILNPGLACSTCPEGQGAVERLSGGVVRCQVCAAGSHIRVVQNKWSDAQGEQCRRDAHECIECAANHEPVDSQTRCQQCNRETPFRSKNGATRDTQGCRRCWATETFKTYSRDEPAACVLMQRMAVAGTSAGFVITPYADQMRAAVDDQHSEAVLVPEGYYLNINVGTHHPCAGVCSYGQFAHFCGTAIAAGLGTGGYVRDTMNGAWMTLAEAAAEAAAGGRPAADFALVRSGRCQQCTKCVAGEYNGDCGANNAAGSCQTCRGIESCAGDEYLDHPDLAGCAQQNAMQDYTCQKCRTWTVQQDKYYIVAGCGRRGYDMWHKTVYGDIETVRCELDTTLQRYQASTPDTPCAHDGLVAAPHERYGNHSLLIPYCPAGYSVAPACVSAGGYLQTQDFSRPYKAACCQKCRVCDAAASKRSGSWATCPGDSTFDTQVCAARCDNGYYENEGRCKMCTVCAQGEIV